MVIADGAPHGDLGDVLAAVGEQHALADRSGHGDAVRPRAHDDRRRPPARAPARRGGPRARNRPARPIESASASSSAGSSDRTENGRLARRRSSWWTKNSTLLTVRSTASTRIGLHRGGPRLTRSTMSANGRAASVLADVLAVVGEERGHDPGPGVGATLPDDEVGGEVLGRPVAAQGRGVRTDLEHRVAQRRPFGTRGGRHGRQVTETPTLGSPRDPMFSGRNCG